MTAARLIRVALRSVTLALAMGATAGCAVEDIGRPSAPRADGPRAVVLFDPSSSAVDERKRYLEQFARLNRALAARHGVVRVTTLSGNTLSTADWPVQATYAPPPNKNAWKVKQALDRQGRNVDRQVARLLDGPASSSDLLGGIQFAGQGAQSLAGSGHKVYLYVFSDAIQWTRELAFTPAALKARSARTVVRELAATGSLPNLRNVQVVWVGGGRGARNLDRAGQNRLKQFWTAYITKAGGTLRWEATLPSAP